MTNKKSKKVKEQTKLKPSNYVIAYLDILGATEYMRNDSQQFLKDLKSIYEKASMDINFTKVVHKKNIFIKIFSDNILIAVKTSRNDINRTNKIVTVANLVGNIYDNALEYGYLIRGCITEGEFFRDKLFVFGKALVEAVEIEEKIAIYPRIIVQNNLHSEIPRFVIKDNDGKYYLHSFVINGFRKHKEFRNKILIQLKKFYDKESIRQKIMWLINYFNLFYGKQLGGGVDKYIITERDIAGVLSGNSNYLKQEVVNV